MTPIRTLASSLALSALVLAGCSGSRELEMERATSAELQRENKRLEQALADSEANRAQGIITTSRGRGDSKVGTAQNVMGADGNVYEQPMETVIEIENSILFKPGKNELSSQAKATLARVAQLIKDQYPNHYVRVDGHTDDTKIVRSKDKWEDNWDLSGGRGQAVLHYLIERGVSEKDIAFAGYAYQRPLAPNTTDANRSKNRRVEIKVIPKVDAPARSSRTAPAGS